jgi:CO/xanthine dehydrogenase FAD-binding subunit
VDFLRPGSLGEALEMKAAVPEAVPIAGGTDVMVELNFDHRRPPALLDLTRIDSLAEWSVDNGMVTFGAGLPYTRVIDEMGTPLPGLAIASRTVGSPQIRNASRVAGV